MHTSSAIRKIFEGVVSRREMYRMFNRHRGAPAMADCDAGDLFAGEWFEIAECDYDYMLDILPPLFMHGDMFALSEYMAGSVTQRLLCALNRWPHALVSRLLRPLRSRRARAHEGGHHRPRDAAGARHDPRRAA